MHLRVHFIPARVQPAQDMNAVEYLNKTVWASLRATEHGVGVYAIRDIEKGQQLTDHSVHNIREMCLYTLDEPNFLLLAPEIRALILDRTIFVAGKPFTFLSPNAEQTLRSFMNHSKEPNSNGEYATRDIAKGEEITEDYNTLVDDMHPLSKQHHQAWL